MPRSPFFHTPPTAHVDSLAILHLKRDNLVPVKLGAEADDGYAEGAVTNTRFGSFPHSTLIDIEWGRQVGASRVDTGSRGRKGKAKQEAKDGEVGVEARVVAPGLGRKRTSDADGVEAPADESVESPKKKKKVSRDGATAIPTADGSLASTSAPLDATTLSLAEGKNGSAAPAVQAHAHAHAHAHAAASGFIHLLPPTPESWTYSLDHRTQVVYTPDYSYILQRLRVKPGSRIIEAGAGSGSFTHAAARAVFSPPGRKFCSPGKVFSYEFHAPRVETLQNEIEEHGLEGVVQLTHRDVCTDAFLLPPSSSGPDPSSCSSPNATAIFLDLPAPWLALRHLVRSSSEPSGSPSCSPSPLDPTSTIHLCTFSPCIEQVQATTSHLRKTGWTEIQMVEVQNRRIDVRREQVGLQYEGLRGVNASAATVEESVQRLREVEKKMGDFHTAKSSAASKPVDSEPAANGAATVGGQGNGGGMNGETKGRQSLSKQARLEKIKKEAEERKTYKEGNLVHRTEPEVKTHTSYLVFAVLPPPIPVLGEEDVVLE
jgi:tRNA (adenine57-N1/adenine58-N1)-methyltransferase catalytic subunit